MTVSDLTSCHQWAGEVMPHLPKSYRTSLLPTYIDAVGLVLAALHPMGGHWKVGSCLEVREHSSPCLVDE